MDADSSKEEERIQRAMNNRKQRGSMIVKTTNESTPPANYRQSVIIKPAGDVPPRTTTNVTTRPTVQPQSTFSTVSSDVEQLQLKKRTILGTIASTRRDLDEVRNEIAKLKTKEAELVALLEKREQSVQQLTQEIESLEQKDFSEEIKKKEEEKARKIKEEIEKRRKEEDEEERKKEEEQEKKILNPQPVFTPRALSSDSLLEEDGLNAEELRIMRAMSRAPKGAAGISSRASAYKPTTSAPAKPQPVQDHAKIAEENKKKEEEQRILQLQQLQQRIAHLQISGGVTKVFVSPPVYDYDSQVKICGDFTQWEEIPITTPVENNCTYSVTWQVSPGPHFYRFKIDGKWEINKNIYPSR
jgi:DNA polymerase III alpha subunit (gram-positive type)